MNEIPNLCNTKYKAFKLRNPSVILGSGVDSITARRCCYGDDSFQTLGDVIKHLGRIINTKKQ